MPVTVNAVAAPVAPVALAPRAAPEVTSPLLTTGAGVMPRSPAPRDPALGAGVPSGGVVPGEELGRQRG